MHDGQGAWRCAPHVTAAVIAALGRAVARGVVCRVLIDGIGTHRQSCTWSPPIRWNSPTFDVTTTKPLASAVPAIRTS